MSNVQRTGILGVGYKLPSKTRSNDDPVFDYLKKSFPSNHPGFQGFENRYVLDDDQTLTDLMVPAAQLAMKNANVTAANIDALVGYASVSEYITPNELAHVHQRLNLPPGAWVLPVSTEHGNFLESLLIARSLVQSEQARNVLIVCGGNWTRYVNYQSPESFGASDGAGAAVYGLTDDDSRFELIDTITYQATDLYNLMYVQPDPVNSAPGEYTKPVFHIDPLRGKDGFTFAELRPPKIIEELLDRNKVSSKDIALITHQTLKGLMDNWNKNIQPGQYLDSMTTLANMTLATLPVNLAYYYEKINKDYLVFLSLGIHLHTTALLLKRNTTMARGNMDDNTIDTYLKDFVRETSDIVKIKTYRGGDLDEKTVQANIQEIQDYLKKSAQEFNETQTNLKLADFSWSKDPYALDGFKLGTGAHKFWLISHLDTVPPAGDDWGPFDPKVEDREYRDKKTSFLKGRGTLDDKGPAILAFNVLKAVAKHFDGEPARLKDITIEVLFDTSEETDMAMPHYFETLKDDEKPFFGIVFDGVWSIRAEKGVERPSFTIQRGVEKLKGLWIDSLTAGQKGSVNQIPSTAVATIKGDDEALSRFGETVEKAYKEFGFDDASYKRAKLKVSRKVDHVDLTTLVSGAQHGSAPDENRENGANPLVSLANFLAHLVDAGELAENAIGRMCQFIAWGWGTHVFGETHPDLLERYDEVFQKGNGTTYALTFFETTTSAVTLAMDIRYALGHHSEPWTGDEGLLPGTSVFPKIFETLVKRFNDQKKGLAVTVQTKMAYAPDVRNPNNPNMVKVLRAYKKVTGQESDLVAVGGGTDAKGHPELLAVGPLFLDKLGPPVNYHGINEGAPIDDLETSAKILYRFIVDEVVPPVPRKS